METLAFQRYLSVTPKDLKWGGAVNSVGHQSIAPGSEYPPQNHPTRYIFKPETGRILDEFQLVYISSGSGLFRSTSLPEGAPIKAGDCFLLFPGEWHSYHPDSATGWQEYWIGFNGKIMQDWLRNGFISRDHPVFHVGMREQIASLYNSAMEIASAQESGFQYVMCSIVTHIASLVIYHDSNTIYQEGNITSLIQEARMIMTQNNNLIKPEDVASSLGISYSKFRKAFKDYTGIAPGKYMQNARINKAKELLTNTSEPVKSIALTLQYENENYFFTAFKNATGITPLAYRQQTTSYEIG